MNHFLKYIKNPLNIIDVLIRIFPSFIPDKMYLTIIYKCRMGKWINWKNPKSFTEKIQWLKLYNRSAQYTQMVDKIGVKEYVAKIIGPEYIIPTICVWDKVDDIKFDTLPNQFVLKTTHGGGSGGVVICRDKSSFDKVAALKKLKKSLATDIYRNLREWPYKNVPKRIIAEKLMASVNEQASNDLTDYKFYCFNGEPKFCQVIRDRNSLETIDFYDMQWQHQDFVGLNPYAQNGEESVEEPDKLDIMWDICRKLSQNIPFVRVDLYLIDSSIYFGELTFFPSSGIGKFSPNEWNIKLGQLLTLPTF